MTLWRHSSFIIFDEITFILLRLKEAEEKNKYVLQEKQRIEKKLKSEIDSAKSEAGTY